MSDDIKQIDPFRMLGERARELDREREERAVWSSGYDAAICSDRNWLPNTGFVEIANQKLDEYRKRFFKE